MKKIVLICSLLIISTLAFTQNERLADSLLLKDDFILKIQQTETDKGNVTIKQDSRIHYLVNKHIKLNESQGTIEGWRIQIYNSSGKESKEEAKKVREKFLSKFPEVGAYLIYQPPYFKIRVGDFRTRQDGFALYKEVSKSFPVLYFVPDNINFPELD